MHRFRVGLAFSRVLGLLVRLPWETGKWGSVKGKHTNDEK